VTVSQTYGKQLERINEVFKKYNFEDFPIIKDLKVM